MSVVSVRLHAQLEAASPFLFPKEDEIPVRAVSGSSVINYKSHR